MAVGIADNDAVDDKADNDGWRLGWLMMVT